MSSTKKVLILTYYWPPANSPGVQRVLKFVQYLPAFNWQPVVVTVRKGDYPAIDLNMEKEVPQDIKIYKLAILEPYNLYRKFLGRKKDEKIPVAVLSKDENLSFKNRIANWIRSNLFVPDARILWYFSSIKKIVTIIKNEKVDLILVSSPPHSLQLIGRKLKKITGLPYVADLRDPWTDIFYYQNLYRWKITKRLDQYLEKKCLEAADRVVTVSKTLIELFKRKTNNFTYTIIPNGFDVQDFAEDEIQLKQSTFTISHIGNLSASQNPLNLWAGLSKTAANQNNFYSNLELNFIGKVHADIISGLQKYGLMEKCNFYDYVAHKTAVSLMQQSQVLLLIIPDVKDNKGILTGKLFEYLASARPILSIGPEDGDAAEILKEVDGGAVYDPSNREGITNAINRMYRLWLDNSLHSAIPDKKGVSRYERKKLCSKLADVLNDLINKEKINDKN